jgi:hypothetical protein
VFSAAAGLLLAALCGTPLRPAPRSPRAWLSLAPIVACTAGTMFLGNAPYMHLSLSFIQILKAFTPALTLLVGVALRVERLSLGLLASLLLIAAGTGCVCCVCCTVCVCVCVCVCVSCLVMLVGAAGVLGCVCAAGRCWWRAWPGALCVGRARLPARG